MMNRTLIEIQRKHRKITVKCNLCSNRGKFVYVENECNLEQAICPKCYDGPNKQPVIVKSSLKISEYDLKISEYDLKISENDRFDSARFLVRDTETEDK